MSRYHDYDFDMTYKEQRCTGYHREWRNHEANVWQDAEGHWMGDMISYGEWDDIDGATAEAVAYAFSIIDEPLVGFAKDMFEFYFGGRKVEA